MFLSVIIMGGIPIVYNFGANKYCFMFCTIVAISWQKEARSRDYALLLSNDAKDYL